MFKLASAVCGRRADRSLRAHELEGVDDLLAVRTQVDYASALGGELVFVQCRHRIAEHQRIDNPDGGRLHLSQCPLASDGSLQYGRHRPTDGLRAPTRILWGAR